MFLAFCEMEWVALMVLSLCLPVWTDVKVIQPYSVVSANGKALVQCFVQPQPSHQHVHEEQNLLYMHPNPEELRVTLLKGLHGTQELCSSIFNFTEEQHVGVEKTGEVQCSVQVREGAVEVTVSGLKSPDTDLYRCEIEVFYPPPLLRLTGNGTLIHVLDSADCAVQEAQSQLTQPDDEREDDEGNDREPPVGVAVALLLMLVMIVLLVIIFFQTLQCVQGKRPTVRPAPPVPHKVDAVAFSCADMA
ncbi:uncharacterized protein V6R79_002021 [Siganus canaliculatus]